MIDFIWIMIVWLNQIIIDQKKVLFLPSLFIFIHSFVQTKRKITIYRSIDLLNKTRNEIRFVTYTILNFESEIDQWNYFSCLYVASSSSNKKFFMYIRIHKLVSSLCEKTHELFFVWKQKKNIDIGNSNNKQIIELSSCTTV